MQTDKTWRQQAPGIAGAALLLSCFCLTQATSAEDRPAASNTVATVQTEMQAKEVPAQLKNDMSLLNSLSVNGWEAASAAGFNPEKDRLIAEDGKAIQEIGGKPVSIVLEYGCLNAASREFRRGQRRCTITLLFFNTADGAYGAYSTLREGSSTVVVRGQGSSEEQNSISFFSGNHVVFLSTTAKDDDEAKEMLGHLADRISPKLQGNSSVPRVVSAMPSFERVKGSEKFFMGLQATQHFTNLPFIESLALDQSTGIAYAEYKYSSPISERLRLLLAEYHNPQTAKNAFNSFVANMSAYGKKTAKHNENQVITKLSDSYLMCGLSGAKVYVISGARKAASTNILSRDL